MYQSTGSLTLLHALFRRTAPMLATQLVLTILFCLFVKDIDLSLGNRGMMDRGDVRTMVPTGSENFFVTILLVGVNAIFAIGTVLLMHSDSRQLRMSLPTHVFLLPMTYRKLVTIHMVYGAFAVAVVTFVAAALAHATLIAIYTPWLPATLAALAYIGLQAWAMIFGGRRTPTAAIMGLLGFGILFVALIRNEYIMTALPSIHPAIGIATAATIAFGIYECAVRLGRGSRFRAFDGSSHSPTNSRTEKLLKPFRSPFWTQAWYEWRNIGWVLPSVLIVLLTLYFVAVPILTGLYFSTAGIRDPLDNEFTARFMVHWGQNQQVVTSGMLTAAIGAGVLTGAYLFLVSGEWRQKSTFLRTRPMTTEKLAGVRLFVLLFSTALSTTILMATFAVVSVVLHLGNERFDYLFWLRQGFDHVPDVFVVAFFAGSLFLAMWTGLWIVNVSLGLGTYGIFSVIAMLASYLFIRTTDIPGDSVVFYVIERTAVWSAAVIWLIGSLWAFRLSAKAQIIPAKALGLAAVCWVIYSSSFLYYGLGIRYYVDVLVVDGITILNARVNYDQAPSMAIPFTHPVDWVLWAGLSLFPILPIVTLPHRLNTMRRD